MITKDYCTEKVMEKAKELIQILKEFDGEGDELFLECVNGKAVFWNGRKAGEKSIKFCKSIEVENAEAD